MKKLLLLLGLMAVSLSFAFGQTYAQIDSLICTSYEVQLNRLEKNPNACYQYGDRHITLLNYRGVKDSRMTIVYTNFGIPERLVWYKHCLDNVQHLLLDEELYLTCNGHVWESFFTRDLWMMTN